jgi:tripartite-type tricarboxylate transporter receptor subunit TctC
MRLSGPISIDLADLGLENRDTLERRSWPRNCCRKSNMLTRMVTGLVFSLILMLQSVQDYPTKPVRLIEPFGAGGGPDLIARALGQKLSESWGQPVTVENHPGAGSTAGPALVAKSPADGYTLLVSTSAQAYSAALLKNLPYDPLKDFIPVAPLTSQPYVCCKADVKNENPSNRP